mgnify:CR=1 FL=1
MSLLVLVGVLLALIGTAPGTGRAQTPAGFYATRYDRTPSVRELGLLGQALFTDRTLSASGRMACSTCHDPSHGMTPANALAVQPGGLRLADWGTRAVPTLKYLQSTPAFSAHATESDGNDSEDQGPAGGYGWDGRFAHPHDQVVAPLLSPLEMANHSVPEVLARLRRSPHAARMQATFGPAVLQPDHALQAWNGMRLALEVYQQDPATFAPYTSKYDAFLRGQVALAPAERRGLALFNAPDRGNCARCHVDSIRAGGFPAFTDFGFVALGVPRNPDIPANRDPAHVDLGLCGPERTDLAGNASACGLFKTPTLRNVALKRRYFHNGLMSRLEDVVRFYAQRDTHPERYYPRNAQGQVQLYNDLPTRYHANIDQQPPFGRHPGQPDALTASEIRDVVAFLHTLTDGYVPVAHRAPGHP